MDRLPDDKSLNIKRTFESQRKKVNNIIPVVQKSINKNFFLVTDGVIKHVIYERHWQNVIGTNGRNFLMQNEVQIG